jgi:hypothetical protein
MLLIFTIGYRSCLPATSYHWLFNAIKLLFNFQGLCLPGLGMHCYVKIGSALMEILPCLLPTTTSDVKSAISMLGFESKNGFDLLWRILELTVPGFNPTVPILPPTWSRDSDMFDFCKAISYTSGCKPKITTTLMPACAPPSSCAPSLTLNMSTLSHYYRPKSMHITTRTMTDTFLTISDSAALQL